eukprot:366240-Chlamydomonas_euryale.AAC.7
MQQRKPPAKVEKAGACHVQRVMCRGACHVQGTSDRRVSRSAWHVHGIRKWSTSALSCEAQMVKHKWRGAHGEALMAERKWRSAINEVQIMKRKC